MSQDIPSLLLDLIEKDPHHHVQEVQRAQRYILQLMAEDASLSQILEEIILMVEKHSDYQMIGSILLLDQDGIHLRHGAGPNLPMAYIQAIDGIKIGPSVGSCGTAAFLKKSIYVSDIANDPLWANYKDLALSHQLQACWSTPIFSSIGKVLGTFAMYYRKIINPSEEDLELVETVTRTAAIAIERKQTEEALRESEKRFRTMADNAPVMIWMTETDGSCTYLSKSWYDFTGQTPETGLRFGWLNSVHPEDRKRSKDIFMAVNKRHESFRLEYRLLHKDGKYRWVIDAGAPRLTANGEFLGYIGSVFDVTELKQLEKQIIQAKNELEKRVEERTAELKVSNEELIRSNKELEAFAYIASHDLQEPLRMVTSYVQLLEHAYKTGTLKEETKEYITYSIQGVNRMRTLINDLLDYSRVRSKPLNFNSHNLEDLLKQAIQNLKVFIQDYKAEISNDPLPNLEVDESQIIHLFQNLIENAIKFKSNKVPKIHVSAKKESEAWIICVRDNGIGIEPQYYEKIFQIFQRLHSRQQYSGSGIGLAICKLVVERHGGKIWVESEVEKGSVFCFTLPTTQSKKGEPI